MLIALISWSFTFSITTLEASLSVESSEIVRFRGIVEEVCSKFTSFLTSRPGKFSLVSGISSSM